MLCFVFCNVVNEICTSRVLLYMYCVKCAPAYVNLCIYKLLSAHITVIASKLAPPVAPLR